MNQQFTPDQLRAVLRLVNEDDSAVLRDAETVQSFLALSATFQRKMANSLTGAIKQIGRLKETVENLKTKAGEGPSDDGTLKCLGLPALSVAKAVLYRLQKDGFDGISKNKVVWLTYDLYANVLAKHNVRLTIDHPQCTEWGPQFRSAYKGIASTVNPVGPEGWNALTEVDPTGELRAILSNIVKKYGDARDNDLKEWLKSTTPYKKALPQAGEKWNKVISDADIRLWKAK